MAGDPCSSNHAAAAQVQVGDHVGLDAAELAEQELAEQRVVAEPPPAPIERHQEGARCLELAQHALRVGRAEHGIAERGGEGLEHGGAPKESLLVLGQLGERLAVEVVGDVPVVARHRRRRTAAVARDRGGEEQADGPSLGAFDDLGGVVGAQRRPSPRRRSAWRPRRRARGRPR